jgi:hypothetical protein
MNHNLCRISSDARTAESASTSDFVVAFNNMTCIESITRVVVKAVDLPNVFYNIAGTGFNLANSGNSTFSFETGAVPTSITLPTGNYTTAELVAALNADATLAALGFVATFVPLTNKLTFASTTAIKYLSAESGNTMAGELGILEDSVGEVLAYSSTGFVDLSGVKEVYIASRYIADGSNMVVPAGRCLPIIEHIPILVPFGSWVSYISPHPEIDDIVYPSIKSGTTLRVADIQLVDRFDNVLDLGGLSMNVILKLYHDTP